MVRRSFPDDSRADREEPMVSAEPKTPVIARGTHNDVRPEAEAARGLANEDISAIVHDLKNPLSVIMLEAMVLEQRLGTRIPPSIQRGLERIAHNAGYIDRLVSNLLDLAAADANRLELRIERCDLARLLDDAVERTVSTPERDHVLLDIKATPTVEADSMRIERVVSNLVANAVKHGKTPVTVRLDQRGKYACVSVIDSGPGLTAEQARTVFDQHRRVSREQDGYGLGLYISRKIIDAHHGRIGVETAPSRGSRFFFELLDYSSRNR
jgi:signal transduction histidine kinase